MTIETLTHRERLLRTLRRQPVDRLPDYEFGAWRQTLARWQNEGLELKAADAESSDEIISHTFATDEADFGPGLGVRFFLWPPFDQEILEERDGHQVFVDEFGALAAIAQRLQTFTPPVAQPARWIRIHPKIIL